MDCNKCDAYKSGCADAYKNTKEDLEDYKRFVTELLDWAKYNTKHVNNKYRKVYVCMRQQIEADIVNILQKEPEEFIKKKVHELGGLEK